MFNAIKKLFRRKPVSMPATGDAKESIAEPVSAPERPVGRPKIYASAAERQRAFRERKAAAATESATAPIIAPEPIMPAIVGDIPTERQPEPTNRWTDGLQALRTAGHAAIQPAQPIVELPAVKPIEPEPMIEPIVAAQPAEWTPDWEQEARTDLPVRSPEHIALLLTMETQSQTIARIENDHIRVLMARRGRSVPDTQSAIIPAGQVHDGNSVWVKR